MSTKKPEEMQLEELDAFLLDMQNDLDLRKTEFRRLRKLRSEISAKHKAKLHLARMSDAERRALVQLVAEAGGIKSKEAVAGLEKVTSPVGGEAPDNNA